MNETRLDVAGSIAIQLRWWRPGEPRGAVVICHGVNSHGGYYLWTAEQLMARDLAVYALDLRGRGRSGGERLYLGSIRDYLADVDAAVSEAASRDPQLPVFLLGHSAGGVVSCVYALESQDKLAGLVCESFAFQVAAPRFALAAVKGISHLLPHAPVLKLKNEEFSRDPGVVSAMNADPLIAGEVQPAKTVAELVRATERLEREFPRITLPLLILHGTADQVTNPNGSRRFHERAGSVDKTLRLYDGHVHDLLNDLGREQVLADIADWIEHRLPTR